MSLGNVSPGYLNSVQMIRDTNAWVGREPFSVSSLGMAFSDGGTAPDTVRSAIGWSVIPEVLLHAGPFLQIENTEAGGLVLIMKRPTQEQVAELARAFGASMERGAVNLCCAVFASSDTFSVPSKTTDGASQTMPCKFCQITNLSVRRGECLVIDGTVAWLPPCDNCQSLIVQPLEAHVSAARIESQRCIMMLLQEAIKVFSAFADQIETPLLSLRRRALGLDSSLFLPGRGTRFDGSSSPYALLSRDSGEQIIEAVLPAFLVLDPLYPDKTFFTTKHLSQEALTFLSDMASSPQSGMFMDPHGVIFRNGDRLLCDDLCGFVKDGKIGIEFEILPMWSGSEGTPRPPRHRTVRGGDGGAESVCVVVDARQSGNLFAFCTDIENTHLEDMQFRFENAHHLSSEKIRQCMRMASTFKSIKTVFSGKLAPSRDGDFAFVFSALSVRNRRPFENRILASPSFASPTFLEWRFFDVFRNPLRGLSALSRPLWADWGVKVHAFSSCIEYDEALLAYLKRNFLSFRGSTLFDRCVSTGFSFGWKRLTPEVSYRKIDMDGDGYRVLLSCAKTTPGEWGKLVFVYERNEFFCEIEALQISNMDKLKQIQSSQDPRAQKSFFFRCTRSNKAFLSPKVIQSFKAVCKAKKDRMHDVGALVCSFRSSAVGFMTVDEDTAFPYYRWGSQFKNRPEAHRPPLASTALSLALGLSRYIEADTSDCYNSGELYDAKALLLRVLAENPRTRKMTDHNPLPHTLRVDGIREGCLRVLNAYFVSSRGDSLCLTGFPENYHRGHDAEKKLCRLWSCMIEKALTDGAKCSAFAGTKGVAMKTVMTYFKGIVSRLTTDDVPSAQHHHAKRKAAVPSSSVSGGKKRRRKKKSEQQDSKVE